MKATVNLVCGLLVWVSPMVLAQSPGDRRRPEPPVPVTPEHRVRVYDLEVTKIRSKGELIRHVDGPRGVSGYLLPVEVTVRNSGDDARGARFELQLEKRMGTGGVVAPMEQLGRFDFPEPAVVKDRLVPGPRRTLKVNFVVFLSAHPADELFLRATIAGTHRPGGVTGDAVLETERSNNTSEFVRIPVRLRTRPAS